MTIEIVGAQTSDSPRILTAGALDFVDQLHAHFLPVREELLTARRLRRAEVARNRRLDFLQETELIRNGEWSVAPAPADLCDRRVEITGPTDRKMTINALNSGARVWLADLEDASSPTWENVIGGQGNLYDAIRRTISYTGEDGRAYELRTDRPLATIIVRPRGWHLPEAHLRFNGGPACGALVDFGLYFFHNARELLARGSGPYFYLPKLESHLEARLWNDVFTYAQQALGIPHGTVRATVLIETIPAAFEMEEILYELRCHASGLNAGRWDYLFSFIKYFRDAGQDFVLPDRGVVTMTTDMMRSYAELLVKTCHRRGAFAIGGMAAFIPSRSNAEVNATAFAKVRADKEREAGDGFDGSWVAHPDLVPICQEVFDRVLGTKPNQLDRLREDVSVTAADLLDPKSVVGAVTAEGVRTNVEVSLLYLSSWLMGSGAVGIHNLMEDAATAEISRSQIWQWVFNGVRMEDGRLVTKEYVEGVLAEEYVRLLAATSDSERRTALESARALFAEVALDAEFADFLTLPAYQLLG